MQNNQKGRYHSRADEYRKRYGKRPCAEWYMRTSIDEAEYRMQKKIDASQKRVRKETTTLAAAGIAINMVISLLLRKACHRKHRRRW